jgi:hypothetical protein
METQTSTLKTKALPPFLTLATDAVPELVEGTASAPSAVDKIGKILVKNRPKAMAFRFTIFY